jgi:XTP/dITP diphosphohydrolase
MSRGGFGYDPLFSLPELDQTMANLHIRVKFALSLRSLAFAELMPRLAP